MREKLTIIKATILEEMLFLETEPQSGLGNLKASGQMLVDSDGLSFIYLAENANDYTYIVISSEHWLHLKKAKDLNISVYLSNGTEKIELLNFQEELDYLIENIKGNSNYGEEMVAQVEAIF